MRRLLGVPLVIVLLASCNGDAAGPGGDGDQGVAATPSTSTTAVSGSPSPTPPPPPSADEFADTASTFCAGGEGHIEMAFAGTVAGRDDADGVPWVTFDVDAWFTDDLGTEIGLWGKDFDGTVGEKWLIAASRYSIGSMASGDVLWCASALESPSELAAWEERYGGSVVAGGDVPESEPAPGVLRTIDAAEALWKATAPTSYTAAIAIYDRDDPFDRCGAGTVRVTVVDGETIQARDLRMHCDVPLDQAPSLDDLFDMARQMAGALDGPADYDDTYGFIRSFSGADRSIERSIWVEEFFPHPYPLATTRQEAVDEARAKWEAAGISSYSARVDVQCFCGFEGPVDVEIRDGEISPSADIPEWAAVTVSAMFDAIESQLDADHLEVAFHPELGYPISARIDPVTNASDDETEYFILELTRVTG
jgi:hypothetical protein